MSSTARADDLATAREMARRIVEAAGDRVERIILFGSRARGEAHPDSDYDLLVVTTDEMTREEERELYEAARLRLGVIPEVWTVPEDVFQATRGIVGCLSYFACYDGVTIHERPRLGSAHHPTVAEQSE